MTKELELLVDMSRKLGRDKNQILGAGGNTSWKDSSSVWVKSSGSELGQVTRADFVECDRQMLESNLNKHYSSDPGKSFREARKDLLLAMKDHDCGLQPSVETSIHVLLQAPFIAHTHPTLINALTSSKNGKETADRLLGGSSVFVDYNYPGFALFTSVKKAIDTFREKHSSDPDYIFLKNHGIVVGGDSPAAIEEKFETLFRAVNSLIKDYPEISPNQVDEKKILSLLPALRMMLSGERLSVLTFRSHSLADHFMKSAEGFEKIHRPFCFDHVKHGQGRYLYIDSDVEGTGFLEECRKAIESFRRENAYLPRLVLIKNLGFIAAAESAKDSVCLADIFDDQMKISYLSGNFGGPVFLADNEIELIRERLGYGSVVHGLTGREALVGQKIAIVTGGAQGFGEGIVRSLFAGKANIVIADLNMDTSEKLLDELNKPGNSNKAIFVKTDVSDPLSVENLIIETVREFGGLDLMISNAGVLFAGGLDEMDPGIFDLVTRVNYKGYFLCAKYSSAVMKLQFEYSTAHFFDIIQINSKSGLKGSNKNFAYAGGKFGGIGLTQSFAMELMPYRIKVNSIAPGNLFDGPLWSDPEKGLFVQYLNAGKVPGAKTIAEVKRFYEAQVPANRGCMVEDVMKAVYYIIDQEYETGQAVPVTGGQIMLN